MNVTAETIARALGLRRAGAGKWYGKCPACGYRGGFTLTERRAGLPLVYCHAGRCEQADLIAALYRAGLWRDRFFREKRSPKLHPVLVTRYAGGFSTGDSEKRARALAIWRRARPADGTLAEAYLRTRCYTGPIPSVLRVSSLKHPRDRIPHPAMVAAVDHELHGRVAVHRTFLRGDGSSKADLDPNKMTFGPCKGGAVRLAPAGATLAIAEGIESALCYMQRTGTPTWAALSAGGIRSLILPDNVTEVVIATDPDPVGMMAARVAARRWLDEGRLVAIARPPLGVDFNDLARAVAA